MSDVKVTVKSVKGHCSAGYKQGDYFIVKDGLMIEAGKPAGICMYALPALIHYLSAYCRETSPDDWINQVQELQCPDSSNTVIFGLERM
jgi:uncharacterized repeat protein (TIGR04076 family)